MRHAFKLKPLLMSTGLFLFPLLLFSGLTEFSSPRLFSLFIALHEGIYDSGSHFPRAKKSAVSPQLVKVLQQVSYYSASNA